MIRRIVVLVCIGVLVPLVQASRSHADVLESVDVEKIRQYSGLPALDNVPLHSFNGYGGVTDLLVRCWTRQSSDWSEFAARFQAAECSDPRACAYLNVYRAWLGGSGTLAKHLQHGSRLDGFAIIAMFAKEPDVKESLLQKLPPGESLQARRITEKLDWLWDALNSPNVFLTLAKEDALDLPYRGRTHTMVEHNPFITVGRSLGFAWRRELDKAILMHEDVVRAKENDSGNFNCVVADSLFLMSEVDPSSEALASRARMNADGCVEKPIRRVLAKSSSVHCCAWHLGLVVLAGSTDPTESAFGTERIRSTRIRPVEGMNHGDTGRRDGGAGTSGQPGASTRGTAPTSPR